MSGLNEQEREPSPRMRYSVHRWAPTQPTPTLDFVLWLREAVVVEDLAEMAGELLCLAEDADDHHVGRVEITDVAEIFMRHLTAHGSRPLAARTEQARPEGPYCTHCGRHQDATGEPLPGAPCIGCGCYPVEQARPEHVVKSEALREMELAIRDTRETDPVTRAVICGAIRARADALEVQP